MQKSQFLLILTIFVGANHGNCVKSKKKVIFFILTWIALKKDTPQENLNTHPKNQAIQVTPISYKSVYKNLDLYVLALRHNGPLKMAINIKI